MDESTLANVVIAVASGLIGAAGKSLGDRMKLMHEERKEDRRLERERDVSEKDFWTEIGGLKAELREVRASLLETKEQYHALDKMHSALRAAHEMLCQNYVDLGARYDRLRKEYDALLRGAPLEGPPSIPGGEDHHP